MFSEVFNTLIGAVGHERELRVVVAAIDPDPVIPGPREGLFSVGISSHFSLSPPGVYLSGKDWYRFSDFFILKQDFIS